MPYVQKRVFQWVKTRRGAIQTPIWWGSHASNFLLPKPAGDTGLFQLWGPASRTPESPWNKPEALDLWKRLAASYKRRDAFAGQRPYRYAAAAWRDYQYALLWAERLYRAGQFADAGEALREAGGFEPELKNPFAAIAGSAVPLTRARAADRVGPGVSSRVGGRGRVEARTGLAGHAARTRLGRSTTPENRRRETRRADQDRRASREGRPRLPAPSQSQVAPSARAGNDRRGQKPVGGVCRGTVD